MRTKKELDFEINLLPMISVLAICICFLLINSVWVLVGSVDLKQATGSLPTLTDRTPVLVMSLYDKQVRLQLKNARNDLLFNIDSGSKTTTSKILKALASIRSKEAVNAAIVLSEKNTSYQQIVSAIEMLKNNGFSQVGLSTL